MKKMRWILSPTFVVIMLATLLLPATPSMAFIFDTGDLDAEIRWDNTVKYSLAYRVKDYSDTLVADVNYDDGDRNFDKGLVSNRMDWLSEFEANFAYGGFRLSGAAWYDDIYNKDNDNDSPLTNNYTSVDSDEFSDDTRDLHGRNVELLDAFAYGRFDVGESGVTVRAGRHTLIYGETLFFGANGIADAQGPIDLVKLLTVPSSQFKEVLRPVEQASVAIQLTPTLSLGAYYQLRWHESLIPGAGSYLSSVDFIGEGSESWILGPGVAMAHRSDMDAKDSGQGGLQLRYTLDSVGVDFGLYAARYHAKTPSGAYIDPVNLQYRWVYAEDIDTFGVSATGSIGQLNLATEFSYRHNAPLNSDPQVSIGLTGDNDNNILYAVGNTFHANLSGIYVLQPAPVWDGGSFLFELAFNRTLSVSKNRSAIDPHTTRDAWASRIIFEPTYFQVVSGLDLSVPIGVGYNFSGRSSAIANFNGGSSKAGDLSIGINATYRTVWKAGLSYIKYFGAGDTFTVPHNSPTPHLSFNQTLEDRDFIAFNISRAF